MLHGPGAIASVNTAKTAGAAMAASRTGFSYSFGGGGTAFSARTPTVAEKGGGASVARVPPPSPRGAGGGGGEAPGVARVSASPARGWGGVGRDPKAGAGTGGVLEAMSARVPRSPRSSVGVGGGGGGGGAPASFAQQAHASVHPSGEGRMRIRTPLEQIPSFENAPDADAFARLAAVERAQARREGREYVGHTGRADSAKTSSRARPTSAHPTGGSGAVGAPRGGAAPRPASARPSPQTFWRW